MATKQRNATPPRHYHRRSSTALVRRLAQHANKPNSPASATSRVVELRKACADIQSTAVRSNTERVMR